MRIDFKSVAAGQIKASSDDILNRLETGDVLKARVLDTKSGEATLRLFDGSLLRAAITDEFSAREGQNITLVVSAHSEGTIYLEMVKNNDASQVDGDLIKKVLDALKIKADNKNIMLASELTKAGITVDKHVMGKARELMNSFIELDAPKAAFIAAKGLGSGSEGLGQLIKLLGGDLKLGEQLSALKELITGLSKTGDGHSLELQKSINSPADVITEKIFLNNEKAVITTPQTGETQDAADSKTAASVNASAGSNNEAASTKVATVNQLFSSSANEASTTQTGAQIQAEGEAHSLKAAKVSSEGTSTKPQASNVSNDKQLITNKDDAAGLNKGISTNGVSVEAGENANTKATAGTPSNAGGSLFSADAEMLKPADNALVNNTDTKTIKNSNGSNIESLSDELQQLFIDTDSSELPQRINVREIEGRIEEKLDNIKVLIKSFDLSGAEGTSISKAAVSVADNVRVLNHINNNNMIYYQLPLNMHGYNTTAELYVMKRNKSQRKLDPNNNVMFISLDTQNMGRVETLLDVKDRNICINIRTEDERVNSFLKENVKQLYNGLNACGYKLASIKYSLIDSPSDPVDQEKLMKNMLSHEYGKVDLRI